MNNRNGVLHCHTHINGLGILFMQTAYTHSNKCSKCPCSKGSNNNINAKCIKRKSCLCSKQNPKFWFPLIGAIYKYCYFVINSINVVVWEFCRVAIFEERKKTNKKKFQGLISIVNFAYEANFWLHELIFIWILLQNQFENRRQ